MRSILPFIPAAETTEVVYVIDPSDAKNSIEWESSDETIATVSSYGVITAVAAVPAP